MRQRRRTAAAWLPAVLALSVLTACGGAAAQWRTPDATASASTSAPPVVTPAPAPSVTATGDQLIMSVDGIGPYQLGVSTIPALMSESLVDARSPYFPEFCTGIETGISMGPWTGKLTLYFKDELLVGIVTAAGDVQSVSGAKVGMPTSQIERIYGSRVVGSDGYGGTRIYTVTVDDRRLVLQTKDSSTNIREMFVQKGTEPILTPHDGPAC